MIALEFIILILIMILSYVLGYYLTEVIHLPNYSSLFDFKAFVCRKCLSFHICWISETIASLLFHNYVMLVIGILLSIGLFVGLYQDEKSRFIE